MKYIAIMFVLFTSACSPTKVGECYFDSRQGVFLRVTAKKTYGLNVDVTQGGQNAGNFYVTYAGWKRINPDRSECFEEASK